LKGFSIYLNEEWSKEKEDYVNTMADAGFTGIFTSLHISEDDASMYLRYLKPLLQIVEKRNLKLVADISGDAIKNIGLSYTNPKEISKKGFSGLRMDDGIDMETIANLSHYLTVCLNASTLTEANYEQLVQKNADFCNIEAWHNYYPRPNTGLDEQWFYERNKWLNDKGLKISAFVPGDRNLRFPLYKTLPTLEMHRYQNPLASSLSLTQEYGVDDVYIGDPGLSYQALQQFIQYYCYKSLLIHAESVDKKWNAYIYKEHKNRQDLSRDVLRSEQSIRIHKNDDLPPENTVLRERGSITIDNEQYNRYKGELQIIKRELPPDKKVNVIGHIIDNDLPLLRFIQGGMFFTLKDKREDYDGIR